MYEFRYYRVDAFLLNDFWRGERSGGIAYCIHGGTAEYAHLNYVDKVVDELIEAHNCKYTDLCKVGQVTKDFKTATRFVTVVTFRIRDAY